MIVVQPEERNMYDQHWLFTLLMEKYPLLATLLNFDIYNFDDIVDRSYVHLLSLYILGVLIFLNSNVHIKLEVLGKP